MEDMNINKIKMETVESQTKMDELIVKLSELEIEYVEQEKKHKLLNTTIENIKSEIDKLNQIIEMNSIIEKLPEIEGIETLSNDERLVIIFGVGKQECKRYINTLETILLYVIKIKTLYPGWILHSLTKTSQYETNPPKKFYKYTYKTPHGREVTL
jgi:hypothetical protein